MKSLLIIALTLLPACELIKKLPLPDVLKPKLPERPAEPSLPEAPKPEPKPEIKTCVDTKLDPTKPGPYKIKTTKLGKVTIIEPVTDGKCKKVISHYSNGTGAMCLFYLEVNRHLASHGYMATCYESPETGSGEPCLKAYRAVKDRPDVLKDHLLSIGHSQGGNASVHCQYKMQSRYPEVKVVSAGSQPAWGMNWSRYATDIPKIGSPIAVFSGDADTIVPHSWVQRGVRRMKGEHYYYQCKPRCNHMNSRRWHKSFALAFSNGWLLDDDDAKAVFKDFPAGGNWRNMLR